MFAKPAFLISIIQVISLLSNAEARIRLLERDGRAIFVRRFGQAQPAVLKEIAAACGGGICDSLADEAVIPLLAAQPECSQQDMADKIIDVSRQFDAVTQAKMIAAAVNYRQAEKNTPLDYSTNPPTLLNSVFCQKAPKNGQLNGLVQAQDPANDPNLFFDPATGATVVRGSQPNTLPFHTNGPALTSQVRFVSRSMMNGTNGTDEVDGSKMMHGNGKNNGTSSNKDDGSSMMDGGKKQGGHKHHGHKNGTMEDGGKNNGTSSNHMNGGNNKTDNSKSNLVSGNDGNNGTLNNGVCVCSGNNGNVTNGIDVNNGTNTNNATNTGNIGNFGSCSVPEIKFAAGFDGRRETSFEPVDQVSYNHGSAQNIDIITQFMCDQLVNTCNADDTAKSTCAQAKIAADAAPPKTGKQADAFNAVFGKVTDFASVTPLDDQGNPIAARSLRRRLLNALKRLEGYLEEDA